MIKSYTKKMNIPQLLSMSFILVISIGTFLLMLPISSNSSTWTSFIDALFTATSATCVTGQAVVNTLSHWSVFGQIVIITMIEIGGLGTMTLVVLLFLFLGKKLNLKDRLLIHDSLNLKESNDAIEIVKYILKFSAIVQAIGALFLASQFIPEYGFLKGFYYSVFHAISAFCNAGFDLFGDSLISQINNPIIIITISSLILIGGLGFVVWRDILTYRKNRRLLIHTRLTLIMTLFLILVPTIIIFTSEHKSLFGDQSIFKQLINSIFLAITPRTAGFANIDYGMASSGLIMITTLLMFIGGSSGSTAGGIKVTTIVTLGLYLKASLKGGNVVLWNRSLSKEAIKSALLLLIMSLLLIISVSTILMFTEFIPEGFGLEYIMFEVVSCFGTVGLSMGLTPHLSLIGKLLLIMTMFMGRVGLMTVGMSFTSKSIKDGLNYPNTEIMIG